MSRTNPLVTVICLCYNQGRFVKEALDSVLNQTYNNIQLIVVDDASTDESKSVIREIVSLHPHINFVSLATNVGNCRAFNKALELAKGDFIIDLAADDVLLPNRIERGVETFYRCEDFIGVHFSDAEWIDESGNHLYNHAQKFPHHTIPSGNIYKELISRFFICPPTMMFRREVIDKLGGYDENLAYEDFDFWIRSSRDFLYSYTPEVLVKKRIVKGSLSATQFERRSRQMLSTFIVCKKILFLNRTKSEKRALSGRIFYEITVACRSFDFQLVVKYIGLWFRNLLMRYPR